MGRKHSIHVAEWPGVRDHTFLLLVRQHEAPAEADPELCAEESSFRDRTAWVDRLLEQCATLGEPHWPYRAPRRTERERIMDLVTGRRPPAAPPAAKLRQDFLDLAAYVFGRIDAPFPVCCGFGADRRGQRLPAVGLSIQAGQTVELACDPGCAAAVRQVVRQLADTDVDAWQTFASRDAMRERLFPRAAPQAKRGSR